MRRMGSYHAREKGGRDGFVLFFWDGRPVGDGTIEVVIRLGSILERGLCESVDVMAMVSLMYVGEVTDVCEMC